MGDALQPSPPEDVAMTIRNCLPLSLSFLLGGCGVNGGGPTTDDGNGGALAVADLHAGGDDRAVRHVLLISVDGLHQVDAARFIAANPGSTLAQLAGSGVEYTDAHTPTPSDSFPG